MYVCVRGGGGGGVCACMCEDVRVGGVWHGEGVRGEGCVHV